MDQAREAVELFVRSLPRSCYFNIVSFGSRHELLWPQSQLYSPETAKKAIEYAQSMTANFGGTEILQPLEHLSSGVALVRGHPRQVLILTDGQVSNEQQVLSHVAATSSTTRYFALGIGADASLGLVEGIARHGGGSARFAYSNERLQKKVVEMLSEASQPRLENIKVEWESAGDREKSSSSPSPVGSLLNYFPEEHIHQVPAVLPPLASGVPFAVFRMYDADAPVPTSVVVTASSPEGDLRAIVHSKPEDMRQGLTLHRRVSMGRGGEGRARGRARTCREKPNNLRKKKERQTACGTEIIVICRRGEA
jgi:hypothetical protein